VLYGVFIYSVLGLLYTKPPVYETKAALGQGLPMHAEGLPKLTGARHELCTWGEPIRPGVGSLSRKCYTQCVEHNRKGHCGNKSGNRKGTNNGGGAVSQGAEKRIWPAEPPRTIWPLRVL
jgi:hypothetical protein